MNNILTIDLEEWFHANYQDDLFNNKKKYEIRVVDNTHRLLNLFQEYNIKATFFTLGYIGENFPNLIKEIDSFGHEISTHGTSHELIYKQSRDEFKDDVKKSKYVLENIINKNVIGYRAPSWSLTDESKWAWEILEQLGFAYDASVFPIKNYLYGMPSSQRFIYNPKINNKELNIREIPETTTKILGLNIPFSGGFYFRILPYKLIKIFADKVNKENNPTIFYLHPREIDINQPRLKLNLRDNFIHYYGIKACENKLKKVLQNYECVSIKEYYHFDSIV